MAASRFQLSADAARTYESQKVPAMFAPLAAATVENIAIEPDDTVLDVACGTGVILRAIGEKTKPTPSRLAGCDLNRGMVEVARELTADVPYQCQWYEADVETLPFQSGEFSLCFCQQGLQFFPEKTIALREIARVLRPGGRLVLTVWSEVSPLFPCLADALRAHINSGVAEQSLAPFSFRDVAVISQLLKDAGYTALNVRELTVIRALGPAPASIPGEIAGNPVGVEVSKQPEQTQAAIISEVTKMIQVYANTSGFSIPQKTHLIEAWVG